MRTAMIAALSCALLGAVLPAASAYAQQCKSGQANVVLEFMGIDYGGLRETYHVSVYGRSALDFSDVPRVGGNDTLKLYVISGSTTAELLFLEKPAGRPYLVFSEWQSHGAVEVRIPALPDKQLPTVRYVDGTFFRLDFYFAADSMTRHDPGRPKFTTVRLYAKGTKNGSAYTLFDTSNPCGA